MTSPRIVDQLIKGGPQARMRHSLRGVADLIDPPTSRYLIDPVAWAEERAHLELWSKQREILESVAANPRTAVASCHSIGKSFTAATVVAWWIDVHPPGEAFVFTTAPTGAQVKAILWREINKLHARIGDLPGRTNLTEWYVGNELVAFGRKPDEKNPTAAQGTHARYFLRVLDEACGVPLSLWDASSTLVANKWGRTLVIGNPDDDNTEFGNVCLRDGSWNVIFIGYEDTPNFTNEPISPSLAEMLTSVEWVEERRNKWGEESALFTSKCKGRFPVGASPFAVVPLLMAQRCRFNEFPLGNPVEAGIDVGAGGDRTFIWERRGFRAGRHESFVDPDPMRTVGQLALCLSEWGVERVKIDSTGIGWGIAGRLKELSTKHNPTGETSHDAEVIPVNFAEAATPGKQHRLLNKRAELWWDVGREYSRLGRWDISAIDDDTLHELTSPVYEILDSQGKVKIEPKDKIIARLGHSPDSAEALLLAFLETNHEARTTPIDLSAIDLTRGINPGGWMTQSLTGR